MKKLKPANVFSETNSIEVQQNLPVNLQLTPK